eukprot:2554821-Pyramimonas_sp.AAC.1
MFVAYGANYGHAAPFREDAGLLPKIGIKNGPSSAPDAKKANPFAAKAGGAADAKKMYKLQKMVRNEEERVLTSVLRVEVQDYSAYVRSTSSYVICDGAI